MRKKERMKDDAGGWVPRVWPFYLFLVLAVFSPCLFGGLAFFEGDIFHFTIPMERFLRDGFLKGQVPFWDPFLMGGQPFLPDPSTMNAYPPLYLALLFPFPWSHGLFFALHLFWAFLGMHFFLRSLESTERSCVLGSLTFGFSGFLWTEIVHSNIFAMMAWVPWFFGFLERTMRAPRASNGLGAGLTLSFLFLAGHLQISLGVLYAAAAFLLFRVGQEVLGAGHGERRGYGKWAGPITAFFFGALPILGWVWALSGFYLRSARAEAAKLGYGSFNAVLSLDPRRLSEFFWPDSPLDRAGNTILDFQTFQANEGYLGIWALFLFFWAFRKPSKGIVRFAAGAALAAFLIALGDHLPFHDVCCRWVPGFAATRAPSRFLFLYSFFGSVVSAFGFENFLQALRQRPRRSLALAGAYAVSMTLAGLYFSSNSLPQALFLTLGFLGFWGFLRDEKTWGLFRLFVGWSIALGVTACMLCASRLAPLGVFDLQAEFPELSGLQKILGHSRVYIRPDIPYPIQTWSGPSTLNLPVNSAIEFGLKGVRGYNPLSLASVERLFQLPPETYGRLLAVAGIVSGGDLGPIPGFSRQVWGHLHIYLAQEPRPSVYCPSKAFVFPDETMLLSAMGQRDFRPWDHILLTAPPGAGQGAQKTKLSYEWVLDEPDHQVFHVGLERPDWTVFSEVDFPGWKAWVDGKEQPIITADGFLRSLFLSEGDHRVEFRFLPPWLPIVKFGSVLWMAGLLSWWAFRRRSGSLSWGDMLSGLKGFTD